MSSKPIIAIGAGSIGTPIGYALNDRDYDLSDIHTFVGRPVFKPEINEIFTISKLPELPEIRVDVNEPVFNYKKHLETCAKNRKKRKKNKRR